MSHYGPPDGPYDAYADPTGRFPPRDRDQPHDQPRDQEQPREPYEPPSDPWGGHTEPQWAYSPPASTPGWDGPTEPPDRPLGRGSRNNTVLYAAVTVLVILVAGAVGYALYLLSGEEAAPAAGPTESSAAVSPQVTGATGDADSPTPGPTQDTTGQAASRAQEGDCLVNNGTNDEPQMQIVACDDEVDAPVYEVLARVDEPVEGDDPAAQNLSAQQTCEGTEGYTHHYFEKGDLLSFVLCMREAA